MVSVDLESRWAWVPDGTKIAEAVAPVSLTASLTLAKTGFPRCVSPAFFGFVPPTTLVPASHQYTVSFGQHAGREYTVINSLLSMKAMLPSELSASAHNGSLHTFPAFQ